MTKLLKLLLTVALLTGWTFTHAQAEDYDLKLLEARNVFTEFTEIPENSIPPDFVDKAKAILIFPKTIKGGFIFAMRFGRGVALVRDDATGRWSAPAFFRISGGSFGLQIGAQAMDLIFILKDEVALRALLENRFTVGGSLSAVAGPWGRHVEYSADWQLQGSMFSYAKASGLFASVATDGSVIAFDEEANQAYHGRSISARNILFEKKGKSSATAEKLINVIDDYAAGKR